MEKQDLQRTLKQILIADYADPQTVTSIEAQLEAASMEYLRVMQRQLKQHAQLLIYQIPIAILLGCLKLALSSCSESVYNLRKIEFAV